MFKNRAFIAGLILILTLLLLGSATNELISSQDEKISQRRAMEIYSDLMRYSGLTIGALPNLKVENNNEVNAYAQRGQAVLYTGMLNYVKSEDELAAVLAHELSHILLEHTITDHQLEQSILEGNADKMATYLLLRAGYDVCKARDLWVRLRAEGGDYEYNSDHPNYSYRIWQLDFPGC